jgi:DNA-damage-inducible protein J
MIGSYGKFGARLDIVRTMQYVSDRGKTMVKTANLNIRIDPQTKQGAEQLFSTFGITISDAVNIFLRQSLLVGGLPFEMKQPRYNEETEAAMQEARDIMSGKKKAKSYSSADELFTELDAEYEAEFCKEC